MRVLIRSLLSVCLAATGASVSFANTSCLSDIDGNGLVNAGDLGKILGEWGDPCCGSDIDGDGNVDAGDIAALLGDWGAACEPVLGVINPTVLPPMGGIEVEIEGSHLAAATTVSINGNEAAVLSISSQSLVIVAPPGPVGPADLTVETPFGVASDILQYGLEWADILEVEPDPAVIVDAEWRERIIATGLPWRVKDSTSGVEMLLVPPGEFMMGCSPSTQWDCEGDEFPVHQITLTRPFYLGRYEVTQAQWLAVMGNNPSAFQKPSGEVPADQVLNRPVEQITREDIALFNDITGLRLPTEAEWEYACRAGSDTAYSVSPNGTDDDTALDQIAWFGTWWGGNASEQTHPVGQKLPNDLGFHDMHGNVSEACADFYRQCYYSESPQLNPLGPPNAYYNRTVSRGGGFASSPGGIRTSNRSSFTEAGIYTGFRVARSPFMPAETCGDGVDNDLNGLVDCLDPVCEAASECEEVCWDGIDNNGDGFADCDDALCALLPECGGLSWATVVEYAPDPNIVSSVEWRSKLIETGLPWRITDNVSGIEMLLVPPGTFMMGEFACLPGDTECQEASNAREVTISQPFYIGRYEVTNAEWATVTGNTPNAPPDHPLKSVAWENIQAFEAATGLRLPTEAEWEYACRAGTVTAYNLPPDGSNDEASLDLIAWYGSCCGGNSGPGTNPVGQKVANNLGLHDMHGNVREFVEDWYDLVPGTYPETDPTGPCVGIFRVLRGGSWYVDANVCQSGDRHHFNYGVYSSISVGFRVARSP